MREKEQNSLYEAYDLSMGSKMSWIRIILYSAGWLILFATVGGLAVLGLALILAPLVFSIEESIKND